MQIGRDSIMLASGHCRLDNVPQQQQLHEAAHMILAQYLEGTGKPQSKTYPSTQSILPVTYMTPGLPPTMEQPYQTPFSQLCQSAAMQSSASQYTIPAVGMHSQMPPAQSNPVTSSVSTSAPPLRDCN
jgi:hypothetical protein